MHIHAADEAANWTQICGRKRKLWNAWRVCTSCWRQPHNSSSTLSVWEAAQRHREKAVRVNCLFFCVVKLPRRYDEAHGGCHWGKRHLHSVSNKAKRRCLKRKRLVLVDWSAVFVFPLCVTERNGCQRLFKKTKKTNQFKIVTVNCCQTVVNVFFFHFICLNNVS